jgi:hypothetical protein
MVARMTDGTKTDACYTPAYPVLTKVGIPAWFPD